MSTIPLSLYIHLPWCVRKCPYCDFNSHHAPQTIPEDSYVAALLADLRIDLATGAPRPLQSIFIGGGTPSLFSGDAIATLLAGIAEQIAWSPAIEITLEANPGTFEQQRFAAFRRAGVNRLSIGVQSFQDDKLRALGRIHHAQQAEVVADSVRSAGFDNFNLDLMYGLPQQSVADGLYDLTTALRYQPPHLSWYQLTIEPNTVFYKQQPELPKDSVLAELEQRGKALLAEHGLQQYEISAYAEHNQQSRHNMNYWEFGDYLGIGAGAHSKITDATSRTITRRWKRRQPDDYLRDKNNYIASEVTIKTEDLPFEFMLNALRLFGPVSLDLFTQRTGLSVAALQPVLTTAESRGLLTTTTEHVQLTELGQRFYNDVVALFMTPK